MNDLDSFGIISGSCEGFSPEQFNNKFGSFNNRKLFVLNFNIRSFNNYEQLSVLLDELCRTPDVLIITETWNSDDKSAEIHGYKSFHCNRAANKRGGGVSIFISNQLKAKSVRIANESKPEIEFIHVKLTFNISTLKPLDLIAIYRPPNSLFLQQFFENVDGLLDSLDCNSNQILAGDLNICGLFNTPISNQLFNIMRSYAFMPHISRITRPNNLGSSTAIDHIWSNFGTNFDSGVFDDIIISDHRVTFVFLPLIIEVEKEKIRFRNHSEQCIQKLIDNLTNFKLFFPLLSANLDFDSKFNLFFDELNRLYMKCCPIQIKEIAVKSLKKPWISNETSQKCRHKHFLFRNYKKWYSKF